MGLRKHSDKHERRDLNLGGRDPLDVYTRALINLRARAQETPGMTVYVDYGFYNNGSVKWWPGGSSPTFTAPSSSAKRRYDLLYLNSSDQLAILTGTEVGSLLIPPWPSAPANCLPIAFILLQTGQTTITESNIRDARVIWTWNLMSPLGTGAANRLALWSGTNTLSSNANLTYDGVNLSVGAPPATDSPEIHLNSAYNGVLGGYLRFFKDNNGAAVVDQDQIGTIYFAGLSSGAYREVARIETLVDGTPSGANVPGKLVIKTSSGGTPGIAAVSIYTNQDVGIGTQSVGVTTAARLHVVKTTEQLRVGYDANNYFSATVSIAGAITFDATGASAAFAFSDVVTVPSLNLTAISNQLVLQSAGVTGTITWTPTSSNKVLTIPNLTGTVALGAGTLTVSSTNDVGVASHTHVITSSSNPSAASILASDGGGGLTLKALGFSNISGDRFINVQSNNSVGSTNYGMVLDPTYTGSVDISAMTGTYSRINNNSGHVITSGIGFRILNPVLTGAGSTITTLYGLWIDNQTSGGTNYAIYSFGGIVRVDGNGIVVGNATGGDKGAGTINAAGVYYANGTAGVSAGSFSTITAITATNGLVTQLTGSSDERLKAIDPRGFPYGLEAIRHIHPILYRWNSIAHDGIGLPTDIDFPGFSAQNLMSVIPEAVGKEIWKDGSEWLTVNDRAILGAAVNAIQELDRRMTKVGL